jgi:hypothetical protein
VLELVVLAKRVVAEGAEEDAAAVLPHATLALAADGLRQGAAAEMEKKLIKICFNEKTNIVIAQSKLFDQEIQKNKDIPRLNKTGL